jgi:hypothetical protein
MGWTCDIQHLTRWICPCVTTIYGHSDKAILLRMVERFMLSLHSKSMIEFYLLLTIIILHKYFFGLLISEFKMYIYTTDAYPRRGSRGISDIAPRRFTFYQNYLDVRNTADGTSGKPIAVLLQSTSGVCAINPLVGFYDIHGRKREVLFFYFINNMSVAIYP